jgi:methylase of polypeptide subunit release factors
MLTKIKLFPIGAGTNYIAALHCCFNQSYKSRKITILEIGTGSGYQTAVLCMMEQGV